jgi:Sulfotransferase domain
MSGIVWLASYPKSGNTWLRAFLANLLTDAREPFDINKLSDFTMSDMRAGYFEEVAGRPLGELDFKSLNALRPEVHRRMAARGRPLALVKTHHALTAVDGVPTITSEVTAGAIYVVRNPLDVAVSFSRHMGLDIADAIAALNRRDNYLPTHDRMVFQFLGNWSDHVRSWTRARGLRRHVMRYEDMLGDPEASFAAVAAFLGIEAPAERLARAVAFSSFGQLQRQEAARGFRERSEVAGAFFRSGREGIWREYLSPRQIDLMRETHREVMSEFGYIPHAASSR